MSDDDTYGIAEITNLEETVAPDLPHEPSDPESYAPKIALIGTGGISEQHLDAYTVANYDVVALCNRTREKATDRKKEFDLGADVYTNYHEILDRKDVDVVVLTHPEERRFIIEEAIEAGKHVLSQKPFVVDVDAGERLVELAADNDVRLAVNQNVRWAPHWSYVRHAISEGLIGEPHGIQFTVSWNHNWIKDTAINNIEHAILYDFAIHWFDPVLLHGKQEPERVYASYESSQTY